jgi:hypothetical protein
MHRAKSKELRGDGKKGNRKKLRAESSANSYRQDFVSLSISVSENRK